MHLQVSLESFPILLNLLNIQFLSISQINTAIHVSYQPMHTVLCWRMFRLFVYLFAERSGGRAPFPSLWFPATSSPADWTQESQEDRRPRGSNETSTYIDNPTVGVEVSDYYTGLAGTVKQNADQSPSH